MKYLLIPVLLVALAAGAAMTMLLDPAPPKWTSASEAASPRTDLELVARVDALVEENRELRERLATIELRPATASTKRAPIEGFVSQLEFEAFREEVLAALEDRTLPAGEVDTGLKARIADALTTIRKEETAEKIRGYQEKRAQRLEDDLVRMEKWLELAPHQVDGMRTVLLTQYQREEEQMRLWEEGQDPELVGERKREDGERFNADLQLVLTPEQLETFWDAISGRGGK